MEFCLADSFVCHFRPKRMKGWNEEQEFELRNLYDRFKSTDGKKRILSILNQFRLLPKLS